MSRTISALLAKARTPLLVMMMVPAPAVADPIGITAVPLSGFKKLGSNDSFGPFTWRGGLELASEEPKFGGFSGLSLSGECTELAAVSDAGRWLTAKLQYTDGRLSGLSEALLAPMLDSKGKPQRGKVWGDAEAMTRLGEGRYAIAYESRVRIGSYDLDRDGFEARFQALAYPRDIDRGPDNGEIEALGILPDGRFLGVSEGTTGGGNIRAWAWRGKTGTAFSIRQHDDYQVTDLAVLADGAVLTLERSFSRTTLPGMAIRRFAAKDIRKGAVIEPEVLFEGSYAFYRIDNMEGIAACERDGETRITVMSDNNFNTSLQSTLLLQFAYEP